MHRQNHRKYTVVHYHDIPRQFEVMALWRNRGPEIEFRGELLRGEIRRASFEKYGGCGDMQNLRTPSANGEPAPRKPGEMRAL